MRSVGRLTEFEARFRSGFKPTRVISLGGEVRLWGGVGPSRTTAGDDHSTNSAGASLQGTISLHFTPMAALTLRVSPRTSSAIAGTTPATTATWSSARVASRSRASASAARSTCQ